MKPLFNTTQRKVIRTGNKVARMIFAAVATALVAEFARLIACAVKERSDETQTVSPTMYRPENATIATPNGSLGAPDFVAEYTAADDRPSDNRRGEWSVDIAQGDRGSAALVDEMNKRFGGIR